MHYAPKRYIHMYILERRFFFIKERVSNEHVLVFKSWENKSWKEDFTYDVIIVLHYISSFGLSFDWMVCRMVRRVGRSFLPLKCGKFYFHDLIRALVSYQPRTPKTLVTFVSVVVWLTDFYCHWPAEPARFKISKQSDMSAGIVWIAQRLL